MVMENSKILGFSKARTQQHLILKCSMFEKQGKRLLMKFYLDLGLVSQLRRSLISVRSYWYAISAYQLVKGWIVAPKRNEGFHEKYGKRGRGAGRARRIAGIESAKKINKYTNQATCLPARTAPAGR